MSADNIIAQAQRGSGLVGWFWELGGFRKNRLGCLKKQEWVE